MLATEPAGAAVVGWPLLWAVPLLPLRVAGVLDPDLAFAVGFPLSLAANAVSVVAIAHAGCHAAGRRAVGVAAAALFAFWPLLTRPLAGPSAWENGQWNVDVGLHLYTEPLSTALVAVVLALLLAPNLSELRLALAGALAGYATVVKVSNGFLAALALALVARGRPAAGAAVRRCGRGVRAARRRVLAEGVSRDPERPRLLARAGRAQLGRLAPLRPEDAPRAAAAGAGRAVRAAAVVVGCSARGSSPTRSSNLLRAHAPASALPLRVAAGALRARKRRCTSVLVLGQTRSDRVCHGICWHS